MKVAFRVDASLQIGTGHVMRCLTLADALAAHGAECSFICREHPGNLIELICSKSHTVHSLLVQPAPLTASLCAIPSTPSEQATVHSHWLGATQSEDAATCAPILADLQPDWLIVDHYALDACWELALKPHHRKLMVIDDLADRSHACDLLLDQTFGRQPADYHAWVPIDCRVLCGSQYALLRPEFLALRPYSLQRRTEPRLRHLLITMGGVDKDNSTFQILEALRGNVLPLDCRITVVMGTAAPWLTEVEMLAQTMPWLTHVRVGVTDMAQLMAGSDLAIGAAGSTSWERCCLGLPTIMIVLADNQQQVARGLEQSRAAWIIEHTQDIAACLPRLLGELIKQPAWLQIMSQSATRIVDGRGADIITQLLEL